MNLGQTVTPPVLPMPTENRHLGGALKYYFSKLTGGHLAALTKLQKQGGSNVPQVARNALMALKLILNKLGMSSEFFLEPTDSGISYFANSTGLEIREVELLLEFMKKYPGVMSKIELTKEFECDFDTQVASARRLTRNFPFDIQRPLPYNPRPARKAGLVFRQKVKSGHHGG